MIRPLVSTSLFLLLLAVAIPARAQVMGEPSDPYPDPEKFARGLYVEADAGAVMFLGDARKALGPGAALGARVGFDLTRWLAFQMRGRLASHGTDFADRPQSGQLLQILTGVVEAKLSLPLGQWIPFAFGGGGFGRLSSNLLGTADLTAPDVRSMVLIGGGAGVDFHPRSRHFTVGVELGFTKVARLYSPGMISASTHLRYTF